MPSSRTSSYASKFSSCRWSVRHRILLALGPRAPEKPFSLPLRQRRNGGADTLIGGNGVDALDGGSGGDAFVWTTIEDTGTTVDTADTIAYFDFTAGDRINLAGIDASAYVAGNQAFSFIGTAAFTLDATTGIRAT